MCTVSFVGDQYRETFPKRWPDLSPHNPATPQIIQFQPNGATREEVEALRQEVAELKELLLKAKKFDNDTGQPDCDMEDKVAFLKQVAEFVGVDLKECFSDS